jgi:hypothetical protein
MSNQMTYQIEVDRELAHPEELNKNLVKETDCKENKCLLNRCSKDCSALCEVENGYCVYEELEYMKKCQLEYYIEHFYPGENIEEKYNHYYYDCFETEESWGSNFHDDEFENEKQYSSYDSNALFYNKIYFEIDKSECFIEKAIKNFNEGSINDFKVWFRDKFVYGIDILENDHLKYKWSDDLTKILMNLSLIYLDDQYTLHSVGGWSPSGNRVELFLSSVANEPFEAELFELIEGDFELFVDED